MTSPRPPKRRGQFIAPATPSPAKTSAWSHVADWYDQLVGDEGSEYQREIIFPNVLRLLQPQPADRILDIACGQGAFCRLLHERGLPHVTGIDAAPPLIRAACDRSQTSPPTPRQSESSIPGASAASGSAIQYHTGDARDLKKIPDASFTAITCILAIQDIDPIQPVFDSVARCLTSGGGGGRFIIAMMHPCFRAPKTSSWGWQDHDIQFRRIDGYLIPRKHPIITHPGLDKTRHTWTYHRPLQTYIKALAKAGFLIDALEEYPSHKKSQPGPRAKAENSARQEIPMFLALRAVKR
ncbi:MAG: class I SAM-dependent methyltransferase [Phycisphaeraceae bacterium]